MLSLPSSRYRTHDGNTSLSPSVLAEQLVLACDDYSSHESISEMLSLPNPGEIQVQFN